LANHQRDLLVLAAAFSSIMTTPDELLDGKYRLGALLGRGGMSDVYRAVDERTGDVVAVKIVRSSDLEYATRLSQEARALSRFQHTALVGLLDSGTKGDMAYLVMEYVEGESLAETLRRGPLTPAATASLGSSLASGIAYVHDRDVVHRDIKPANILIDASGNARLADFGIARLVDTTTMTLVGTTLGTASYMAPEQLEDHQVGPGADVWSLGIVLLECMTGERVYAGTPSEVVARRLSGPVPLPDTMPVPWKTLLRSMLDHDPRQRPQAHEVAAMLASTAYDSQWKPPPTAARTSSAQLLGAVVAPAIAGDRTEVLGVGQAAPDGDITSVIQSPSGRSNHDDHTVIIPPFLVADVTKRVATWRVAAAGVVLIALLAAALAYGLSSDGTATPAPSTTAKATTTTAAPTTPTTLGSTKAIASLLSDLASAEGAGAIDSGTSQSISDQALKAVTDSSSANLPQAANDLQQAITTVTNAVNDGSLSSSVGQTLQNDLLTLANTLGLSTSATVPTTTLVPGNGHGHGKGHGD
jgi:serine/threonine protein kinase